MALGDSSDFGKWSEGVKSPALEAACHGYAFLLQDFFHAFGVITVRSSAGTQEKDFLSRGEMSLSGKVQDLFVHVVVKAAGGQTYQVILA